MNDIKIGVIGGDQRQLVTAVELAKLGIETAVYAFDKYEGNFQEVTRCTSLENTIKGSSAIVLPMPVSLDNIRLNCPLSSKEINLDEVFQLCNNGQIVAGGRFNGVAKSIKKGVKIYDYYEREELCIANAVSTAEGAVAIAINELPYTLHGTRVLVTGFGRVAKVLAYILKSLGADVTAAARKLEDFAWMNVYGYRSVHIKDLCDIAGDYTLIFNTVPDIIFTRNVLQGILSEALIIDLASKPGGVDMKAAKDMNINVIWALSLPGKVAPVTSGKIIKDSIVNILRDEGIF
jgi:Glutamyl-tRNA reductase